MKKNFWVKLLAVGMSLSLIACSNGGGGAAQPEPEKEEEILNQFVDVQLKLKKQLLKAKH